MIATRHASQIDYFPCAKILSQDFFTVNIIRVIYKNCHGEYVDDLITKIDVKQTFELLSMESWYRGITTLRDVRLRRDTVKFRL